MAKVLDFLCRSLFYVDISGRNEINKLNYSRQFHVNFHVAAIFHGAFMAKNLLSDAKIKAAKPKKNRYGLCDGDGLWLMIYPTGRKAWHLFYNKTSRLIGAYPVLSLCKAREEVLKFRKNLGSSQKSGGEVFSVSAEKWYEHWRLSEKPSPQTEKQVLRRLQQHMLPRWGKKALFEIKKSEVIEMLLFFASQSMHTTGKYVLMDLKRIFRHAINREVIEINPVEYIKSAEILGDYKKSQRPSITDIPALKRLICAIDTLASPLEKYALQLMAIFATRTKELLLAKWDEFDFLAKLWRIPAARMKGREDHVVPIPSQAEAILMKLKAEIQAGDWVFFNEANYNPKLLLNALYKLGYKGLMCGHGFRATFTTVFLEMEKVHRQKFEPVIEKHLAHTEPNATKRAYDRSKYLDDRIEMMEKWAAYLDSLKLA